MKSIMSSDRKKIIAGAIIFSVMLTGIMATRSPDQDEGHFTNLKILSNKLTGEQMDNIMTRFCSELGVKCTTCHIRKKNVPYPEPMDFSSDEKPEKLKARKMLAMTFHLNKKYFNVSMDGRMQIIPKIWCATCHHGILIPRYPIKKQPDTLSSLKTN